MINVGYRKVQAKYLAARLADRLAHPWGHGTFEPAGNLFFVIGHGRSGTQFLAHLFDRATNANVAHEPCVADVYAAQRARLSPTFAAAYVRDYRRWRIQEAARAARPGLYGEVNSRLRHFIAPLRATFPEARMLRLVRDGRDVVRSMLARDRWMIEALVARAPAAGLDDPFIGELDRLDEFGRACWYWRIDTLRSAEQLPAFVRFEDFVRDPDYVLEHIVRPLGLELDRTLIAAEIAQPRNSTQRHVVGDWSDWSAAQREVFWHLCGDVMERHGYGHG